ncbi:unnamed protein product [Ectocarpus sp. 12 AP-2014]
MFNTQYREISMCVIFDSANLLPEVLLFAPRDEYAYIGTVNKAFHHVYGTRHTKVASCFETVSRLEEAGVESLECSKHVWECGSIDVMRHALHAGLVDHLNGALEHAIRSNDVELITVLEDEFQETRVGPSCLVAAVESGSLALVQKYCVDDVLDAKAASFALESNYFHPLDMTAKRMICRHWKTYVGDYLIEAAKRHGHFEILKWLHAQNIPCVDELSETHDVVGEAAAHGNREMVEWMLLAGYHPSACEIPYACHSNDVCYLEWLVTKGCIIDPQSLDFCSNTDSDVLSWLHSKGYII